MLLLFGGLAVINNVLVKFIENTLTRYLTVKREYVANMLEEKMAEKIMNIEYSYLEDPYYLDLKERAVFAIHNQNAIAGTIREAAEALTQLVTLIGLVSVMLTLGPVLIILVLVASGLSLLSYALMSKKMAFIQQEIIPINRRFGYYFSTAMEAKAQKEIRLYNLEPIVTDAIRRDNELTCDKFKDVFSTIGFSMGLMGVISELVSALSYLYVGIRTFTDTFGRMITIGSLTMYVSSTVKFAGSVQGFGEQVVNFMTKLIYLDPYLEFMSLPEEVKQEGGKEFKGSIDSLEFKNVTFTYPKAEKPTLVDISFKVNKGEKISIVGLNGAGKSTLVKLICRMYKADSGQILINGKDIYDYDYKSYMNSISAIFQDYKLFNFTIAENISCKMENTKEEEEKILKIIDEVGMREKIDSLKDGIYSRFGKDYDEDGIEMSGGQSQKIAIARALYKPAELVILDEPASALDPIAEAEVYEKFNSLVEDKTAMYISHRMSSSVFCDRILVIDGGSISDYDTHENLMKKTESLYYKLFMTQAENYKIENAEEIA
ncbi:MAG: ABC transporter ATP-binding protein [Lachnospiraceae bacterium]|nr:ABC transporter ATP-binding protein [Lachnospiraceae bacterium]